MKLSLTLLISSTLSFFLFSCSEKCKECTITTVQTFQGFDQTYNATEEYCGENYENAPANGTVSQNVGGGVTQTVTTNCVDK